MHALGLVKLAVAQVEHRFFSRGFEGADVIRFHKEADLLGTPREAILVFRDGVLVAANRRGLKAMALDRRALGKTRQDEVAQIEGTRLTGRDGESFMMAARPARVMVQGTSLPEGPKPYFVAATQEAMRKAVRLADANIPLLVQGETGVGKEIFARELHRHTSRSGKPFVAINCAALPEALIESELFGYADGAFTGARRQGRKGLIEQADGGILFLDEIGDMPLAMQSRLLRVLQDREVMPLGGKATKVDFLPVCATHRPLKALVEAGQFRPDLYFRLAHFVIELPALRTLEGKADIIGALWRQLGAPRQGIVLSAQAEAMLVAYAWPGNFRQLAATLRAVLALAEPGAVVDVGDLPTEMQVAAPGFAGERLDDITDEAIRRALAASGGNVSKAARALGVDRSTLYRRVIWKAPPSDLKH
jgi:transcriptional regulator of acetoin/glycerol metabolism